MLVPEPHARFTLKSNTRKNERKPLISNARVGSKVAPLGGGDRLLRLLLVERPRAPQAIEPVQPLHVVVGDRLLGGAAGGGDGDGVVVIAEVLGAEVTGPIVLAVARVAVQLEVVVGGAGGGQEVGGNRQV